MANPTKKSRLKNFLKSFLQEDLSDKERFKPNTSKKNPKSSLKLTNQYPIKKKVLSNLNENTKRIKNKRR
jgi:hypothetical protein